MSMEGTNLNSETPFLNGAEIAALVQRLREQQKARSEEKYEESEKLLEEYAKQQGFENAGDELSRDSIEALSDYFRIDFEVLRKMSVSDGEVLSQEFYMKAPKELWPPISAEAEMELDAYMNTPFEKHLKRWKEMGDKDKPIEFEE